MDMMNNYEFNEGIEFEGLIPKVMEADGISTIGASNFNAMVFKNGQLGSGSLEVIDFQAVMGGGVNPEPEPVYDTEIHATLTPPRGFNGDTYLDIVVADANLPSPEDYDMLGIDWEVAEIGDERGFQIYTCEYSYNDGRLEAMGMTLEKGDEGIRPLYLYFGISNDACNVADKIVWKCKIIIDNE